MSSMLAMACAQTGHAQSAPAQSDATQLGEIIVTAQRKTENVQKAAIPIAVVSADSLKQAGVTSPEMLTRVVPSLTVVNSGAGGMSLFVRGVGNFTLSPSFDPAVAFNYDNVYIGRPAGTAGFFYDLERVEVLKGPQGTLYGRNATGGAINVIPNKPALGIFTGYVNGSYGNYDAISLEGAVNVPMGEDGALRLSGNMVKNDGYLSDGSSDGDTKSIRVQMMGELTPSLTVRVGADYSALRGRGSGGTYLGSYAFNGIDYTQTPSPLAPSIGTFDPVAQAYRQTFFVAPAGRFLSPFTDTPFVRRDSYGITGEANLKTAIGDLTIIPSWRYSKSDTINSALPFLTAVQAKEEQYSFEGRFVGKRIGIFDYTIGAMYFKETQVEDIVANQSTLNTYQNLNLTAESVAAFTRITANVSESLRLVGGARFTHDKKAAVDDSENITIICATLPTPCIGANAPLFTVTDGVEGLGLTNLSPSGPGGVVPYLDPNGIPYPGVILSRSALIEIDDSTSKSSFTWRAGIEYDVGPSSLLYATVETGFRVGGLQPVNGYEAYKPEKITAYTIGSKNRFFGNRVQLNFEGFYWKYKDQQIAALGTDNQGVPGFFVQNVGGSTNYGAEVELRIAATPTTRLSADMQYLHTEYDRFTYSVPQQGRPAPFVGCPFTPGVDSGSNVPTYVFNCSGNPAFNSPKWTINLGAEQTIPLGDHRLIASVDTQFRSSRWTGYEYIPFMLQGSTWQTNAQVKFEPKTGNWFIAAYVRNIENDRFIVNSVNYSFANLVAATTNPPRTYGARIGFNF
ncbi:hypothetical protein JI59_21180 (plasmid) [Novosphingobium pentaromativorans US6-1]|nr:hypothetical protein JI59_21180 [Novosphingobium pentaromativorans US6-1]